MGADMNDLKAKLKNAAPSDSKTSENKASTESASAASGPKKSKRSFSLPTVSLPNKGPVGLAVIAIVLIVGLYLPVGMLLTHTVDDDLGFRPAPDEVTDGGSWTVDITTALIRREVSDHGWVANALPIFPGYYIDNMPNYQTGMMASLSRFVVEMNDQIGRSRGSSQADPDLRRAQGAIQYDGEKWSIVASASADTNFLAAADALEAYNQRLATGQAIFDARADNLLTTLERIAADLGSSSAVIDQAVQNPQFFLFDRTSDDHFFGIKGRMYGYAMIMRGLEVDFEDVIRNRNLGAVWTQTITSLEEAARLDPFLVVNASPDGLFLPNHLTTMGFYLLRARTQLKEVSDILLR